MIPTQITLQLDVWRKPRASGDDPVVAQDGCEADE